MTVNVTLPPTSTGLDAVNPTVEADLPTATVVALADCDGLLTASPG